MTRAPRLAAGVLALAFIALHLPFLPASLEDVDSINFALGIRDFDVARHQPHPPGYPVFILAAKAVHVVVPSEARALCLIGILAGGLAMFALVAFFESLGDARQGAHDTTRAALFATLLVMTSPLFWVTATRPLSDVAGLAAALAVQAVVVTARAPRPLIVASLCAGLGAGIRTQVVWLTVPVLVLGIGRQSASERWRVALGAAAAYLAGILAWTAPLVLLDGGPSAYFQALFNQGAEDFSGVAMLWTTPTVRQLARAIQNTFIAPWGTVPNAAAILLFAFIGLAVAVRRTRPALATAAVAFGPYLILHMLFQETATTRYALPLVVPVAYMAARGALVMPASIAASALVGFSVLNVFGNTNALYGYSSLQAPAFQMLEQMRASSRPSAPVLAMHRQHEFDLRRPILWAGLPAIERRLLSPPKHEWLELVKYWNDGGRQPVWFVADPLRSDLALVRRHRPPTRYRWAFNLPMVMGGVRPNEMDWHIIEPPDWYLGEGWSITPETAGLAGEDGRGPGRGGIQGWIRRWPGPATMMIGGRNLDATRPPTRVSAAVDGRPVYETTVPAGAFLRMITLPAGSLLGPGDYATVTVTADGAQLAIDQFDAQPDGRVVFGYGEGWHASEYNPSTGRLWRWTTERATLRVHAVGRALSLRMDGELEAADSSRVVVRAGSRIVAEQQIGSVFSLTVPIPSELVDNPESSIAIETSASYVPAEARWRSTDRRRLGLKIYSCQLVPVS